MANRVRRVFVAAALGITLTLGACSPSSTQETKPSGEGDSGEQITLNVSVFNDFGYTELYKEYMKLHPNITIEETRASSTTNSRDRLSTGLSAGSGLSDIEAVEGDWMPEVMQYTDQWVDLSNDSLKDRWLEWKTAKATDPSDRLLGYGTDSAPNAICYRADLFAAAGLPSNRDEVAKLLTGDWNKFFEVGRQFRAANSQVAWFDSASSVFQGMISQLPNAFENSDGTPIPLADNTGIKSIYDSIVANLDQSAHLTAWDEDWMAAFQGDPKFATIMCPSWMAGFIEEQAAGVTGWDVAPVFPGGASNSGGSYLMVPVQSKHQEAAKALADWLTAPEQQLKAYAAKQVFPSQVEALKSPQVTESVSKFFNDAPIGKIYASQASSITVQPFTGEHYGSIRDIVGDALNRVSSGAMDAEASWQQALADYKDLGI